MTRSFSHVFGLLIFGTIFLAAMFVENIHRFPSVWSRLPARQVGVASRSVGVYECQDFRERKLIRFLQPGETVEIEYVACGLDTRWGVKLADGHQGCYSADDENKISQKTNIFYYF